MSAIDSGHYGALYEQAKEVVLPVEFGRIEIELADGNKISAEAEFDPDVLARLLKGILN